MSVPQLGLEDFAIGQSYPGLPRRITAEDFNAFAALTGDSHPIHYDQAYAAKTRFGDCVAHGLLLTALGALGATPLSARLENCMVAMIEQGSSFRAPVFAGDTVQVVFTVQRIERVPDGSKGRVRFAVTMRKSSGELVMEGFQTYLLAARQAAAA
ncbi:MAG TPA: MaoC/PaaZ C-terminal domain-containing protein [Candidatus Cybelea sp.]|nr:MaoC/PaaZ C-terminal domain-containing protein [Candidatus Cybelea sp.]